MDGLVFAVQPFNIVFILYRSFMLLTTLDLWMFAIWDASSLLRFAYFQLASPLTLRSPISCDNVNYCKKLRPRNRKTRAHIRVNIRWPWHSTFAPATHAPMLEIKATAAATLTHEDKQNPIDCGILFCCCRLIAPLQSPANIAWSHHNSLTSIACKALAFHLIEINQF